LPPVAQADVSLAGHSGWTPETGRARVSFPAGGTAGPFNVKWSVMGVWSED